MSGADLLASAINNALPSAVALPARVGLLSSVGGQPMVATVVGLTADPIAVPQVCFSSWFLAEAKAGGIQGRRVLVIFTEGNQFIIMSTLSPIGA